MKFIPATSGVFFDQVTCHTVGRLSTQFGEFPRSFTTPQACPKTLLTDSVLIPEIQGSHGSIRLLPLGYDSNPDTLTQPMQLPQYKSAAPKPKLHKKPGLELCKRKITG
jgi:hypothetical protein